MVENRDVKQVSPFGFGLVLTGRGSNGSNKKSSKIFSSRKYYGPNSIGFRAKPAKMGYKSNKPNYKFKRNFKTKYTNC